VQDDEPIFRLYGETASLTLIGGRRRIPLALGDHRRGQLARPERRIRGARLSMKRARGKTAFFLKVGIDVECDQRVSPIDWIGGDGGRTDSLHTSNGPGPALFARPSAVAIIAFGALSRRKPRKAQARREDVVARS
jgi:hypothetical protein